MRGISDLAIKRGLDALYFSGLHRAMAPLTAGRGVIFALHRVRPNPAPGAFAPNRMLEMAPEFLDRVLDRLRERHIDVVDMDEALRRLQDSRAARFAVFTFDDGYADSYEATLPIFSAHNAPFTIYVTTGLIDGTADIWWIALEEAIRRLDTVRIEIAGSVLELPSRTAQEKQMAWDAIYWPLRDLHITERRTLVHALATKAGMNEDEIGRSAAMSWAQVREAANSKLVTIGAHTVHHLPVRDMSETGAHFEIAESKTRLQAETGVEIAHFAYPFGNPESAGPREFQMVKDAGFRSAVTMRRGPLFSEHAEHAFALPRVSLNGNYQAMRYIDLFLSGAPFALWNKGQRLNVA